MMKRKRILATGIAMGLVLSMGLQVFAEPMLEEIQAYINHEFKFEFNGVSKELSNDYEVIVYKDRAYVPVRFVAENLGATVDWNDANKLISITAAKAPVVTAPAITRDYRELPLFKENYNFKIAISLFSEDEYGYKVSLTLENKTDAPIQLDQLATIVEVNGEELSMDDVAITQLDTRWYNDIQKDMKTEGYVRLPGTLESPKTLHLEFKVRTNGSYTTKYETMTFDIKL